MNYYSHFASYSINFFLLKSFRHMGLYKCPYELRFLSAQLLGVISLSWQLSCFTRVEFLFLKIQMTHVNRAAILLSEPSCVCRITFQAQQQNLFATAILSKALKSTKKTRRAKIGIFLAPQAAWKKKINLLKTSFIWPRYWATRRGGEGD